MGLPSFAPALAPFYRTDETNKPLVLFRGDVDLEDGIEHQRFRGEIALDWLPSPRVDCRVWGPLSEIGSKAVMAPESIQATPQVLKHRVPRQLKTRGRRAPVRGSSFEATLAQDSVQCGDRTKPMAYAILHVVNFPLFVGGFISWPDGSAARGRLVFVGGGWRMTVDHAPGAGELIKTLASRGGFALTNVARVERVSGERFTVEDLDAIVEAFTYFCWLCAETRCGPVLPVGYDDTGTATWARWDAPWIEPYIPAATWLDKLNAGEAERLFPTFLARYQDPYWHELLKHGMHYLIEAGRPHTVDRAILMAQVMLESFSYSWLVTETGLRTHDAFEADRNAAKHIRAMLLNMHIPIQMPAALVHLRTTRTRSGHLADGPQALVLKRNAIIHFRSRPQTSTESLIDAWLLGAWYSELVMLRVCGFNGLYRNRLSDNVWTGVVERVPWA
jgi:hypothetical protein